MLCPRRDFLNPLVLPEPHRPPPSREAGSFNGPIVLKKSDMVAPIPILGNDHAVK